MKDKELDTLNTMVKMLLKDESLDKITQNLKKKLKDSDEPFIWKVIDLDPFLQNLPSNIKSAWVFVLKKNTPSVAHYHPNSVQHTVMIEGKGKVKIADRLEDLNVFDSPTIPKEDAWYVIDKNIPHEFFPEEEDMVVISFHTCLAKELVEIKVDGDERRVYEKL